MCQDLWSFRLPTAQVSKVAGVEASTAERQLYENDMNVILTTPFSYTQNIMGIVSRRQRGLQAISNAFRVESMILQTLDA